MDIHVIASSPSALHLAPNAELLMVILLDSDVTTCSPNNGTQPFRYGVQEPAMQQPAFSVPVSYTHLTLPTILRV